MAAQTAALAVCVRLSIFTGGIRERISGSHETERPLTGNLVGFNEADDLDLRLTAAPFPGHKGQHGHESPGLRFPIHPPRANFRPI